MFTTAVVDLLVVFLAFQLFIRRVPLAFRAVLDRDLIDPDERIEFVSFEREVTDRLNGRFGFVLGVVFAILGLTRHPLEAGGIDEFLNGRGPASVATGGQATVLLLIGEALAGLVAGLIVWRMLVIAFRVGALAQRFDLRLKLGHPDGCAGFRPLGELCLLNAVLFTIPAIYLAIWLQLGPALGYLQSYATLDLAFLAILFVLAVLTFAVPLWRVHVEMQREVERIEVKLDRIADRIDNITRATLDAGPRADVDGVKSQLAELDVRKDQLARFGSPPSWPIDLSLAFRFGTSQVIPLLTLTGLSQPITDALKSLAGFFSPS
jgi:hypothetical protein